MNPTRHATLMLLIVTALWAFSFPLVTTWQTTATATLHDPLLSAFTLIALRMFPALLLLLVFQPHLVRGLTGQELRAGACLGFVFFLGFALQTWGMATVSPTLSAFLTSLCSVWAPLLAWVFLGVRVPTVMLFGLTLAIMGTVILVAKPDQPISFGLGDGLTLLASLLFGIQMLLLDHLGRKVRPGSLTVGFFATAGLLASVMGTVWASCGVGLERWGTWFLALHLETNVWQVVALLVLLPTVLGFHWMNVYQPKVSASRAALIYLLEPVLAAAISIAMGVDTLSLSLFVGGGLILSGNGFVEVWGRKKARSAQEENPFAG